LIVKAKLRQKTMVAKASGALPDVSSIRDEGSPAMQDAHDHGTVSKRTTPGRGHDPELTRQNILAVATKEFAEKGYSGARVDEIAARTNTSKRMIYYYFEDKEGLFVAVLEEAYRRIRQIEATLDLAHLEPEAAIRALVGFTFDYQNANEDFIRLVMVENIHQGIHLARSRAIQDLNVSVIHTLRDIYDRGVRQGLFREGVDEIDLHMTISALCFFNVSNRATFSQIFKRDMASLDMLAKRRETVIETVIRYLRK
jgi:AcrR family transcriptional regulator